MFKKIAPYCLLLGGLAAACAASKAGNSETANPNQVTEKNQASADTDEGYKDPKTGKVTTKDGRVLICRNETPTGTHLPRKICRWEREKKKEMLRDQADMQTLQRNFDVNVDQPASP